MSECKIINLADYIKEKKMLELNQHLITTNLNLREQLSIALSENAKFTTQITHLVDLLKSVGVEVER